MLLDLVHALSSASQYCASAEPAGRVKVRSVPSLTTGAWLGGSAPPGSSDFLMRVSTTDTALVYVVAMRQCAFRSSHSFAPSGAHSLLVPSICARVCGCGCGCACERGMYGGTCGSASTGACGATMPCCARVQLLLGYVPFAAADDRPSDSKHRLPPHTYARLGVGGLGGACAQVRGCWIAGAPSAACRTWTEASSCKDVQLCRAISAPAAPAATPLDHSLACSRAAVSRDITERPDAPSGVAAFMSAHSKTPCITPIMIFSSGKGVVWGRRGQQLEFALAGSRRKHFKLDSRRNHF